MSRRSTPPSAAVPDDAYRETLAHLFGLRRFGMRPGLEVIRALLEADGHPEGSFHAVHVAGSKGKGSVSAMVAAILQARGLRVGLYTSPHLRSFRERIQIDRHPIPHSAVVEGVARLRSAAEELRARGTIEQEPTFFELTTALAFGWFRSEGVEHAVVEVGLGGRLDATNVVQAPVGVVTTLELEHTEILGPTLTDIAREKAGIFHPGMRGVVGELNPEALREVQRSATSAGVPLWLLGRDLQVEDRKLSPLGQSFTVITPSRTVRSIHLPLAGAFQADNAALAVAAASAYSSAVGGRLTDTAVRQGLAKVQWRARLERISRKPDVYVDVAHTPESARAVAQGLAEIYPFTEPGDNVVVFGCLSDKRVEDILEAFAPLATTLVIVPVRSDRSRPVDEIRRAAVGRFPRIVIAPDVTQGLKLARVATGTDGFALVAGSDYLIGELLQGLEGSGEDEPDLSDPVHAPASVPPRGAR